MFSLSFTTTSNTSSQSDLLEPLYVQDFSPHIILITPTSSSFSCQTLSTTRHMHRQSWPLRKGSNTKLAAALASFFSHCKSCSSVLSSSSLCPSSSFFFSVPLPRKNHSRDQNYISPRPPPTPPPLRLSFLVSVLRFGGRSPKAGRALSPLFARQGCCCRRCKALLLLVLRL